MLTVVTRPKEVQSSRNDTLEELYFRRAVVHHITGALSHGAGLKVAGAFRECAKYFHSDSNSNLCRFVMLLKEST